MAIINPLTRRETVLAAIVILVLVAQPVLPHVPQDPGYHHFADTRTLAGVANGMDTLSNIPFILGGIVGAWLVGLRRLPGPGTAAGAMLLLTFAGLIVTGLGSAWYHAQTPPNDAGLAVDRFGMVIAFAGILGLAVAHKVSERAGGWLGLLVLVTGPFSVWWWRHTGTLAPYAVLQFGGVALLVMSLFWRAQAPGPNWGQLVGAYVLAKVFELADFQIWELTRHTLSGHSLKHLAAAWVAVAVIAPLYRAHRAQRVIDPVASAR